MRQEPQSTPSGKHAKGFFRARLRRAGVILTALVFAACSPAAAPTNRPPASTPPPSTPRATASVSSTVTATIAPRPSSVATATPAATTTAAAPNAVALTLTGDDGVAITLAGTPHKVISLTPATSELMFALGAGDRLVGRTDYDDYPAEVADVPAVATFEGVEMEKVVDIEPDLVLAGGNNFTHDEDIQRMRDLGYPVLVLYAEDLPGVQQDIHLVGQAVGEADAATDISAAIQARIDEVTDAVAGLPTPKTFYEIGAEPALYGPAPESFVADMVTIAGGDPITTSDPAVFEISLEELVTANPDVIVLGDAAYGTCPDQVVARPGWKGITAVKNGDIQPVDDTIVTRPGPRIGDGLAALALAIHPDAAIAPPTTGLQLCASPQPSPS